MWETTLAAAIAVVGSLWAVALTNRHNRRMATTRAQELEQQLVHERAIREADHRHEHRGRLLAERLSAYRAFNAARVRYRRAKEEDNRWWGSMRIEVQAGDAAAADVSRKRFFESLRESRAASAVLEDSIMDLALVASRPVREAADNTKLALQQVARREFKFAGAAGSEDEVQAHHDLREERDRLEAAQDELRDAVNRELNLDA